MTDTNTRIEETADGDGRVYAENTLYDIQSDRLTVLAGLSGLVDICDDGELSEDQREERYVSLATLDEQVAPMWEGGPDKPLVPILNELAERGLVDKRLVDGEHRYGFTDFGAQVIGSYFYRLSEVADIVEMS